MSLCSDVLILRFLATLVAIYLFQSISLLHGTAWRRSELEGTWAPRLLWEVRVDEWGRPRPWRSQGRRKVRWLSGGICAGLDCFSRSSRRRWCWKSAAIGGIPTPSRTILSHRQVLRCAVSKDLDLDTLGNLGNSADCLATNRSVLWNARNILFKFHPNMYRKQVDDASICYSVILSDRSFVNVMNIWWMNIKL